MTKDESAPDGVGPHEGRELELMLAGGKPLAMFGDGVGSTHEFPEIDFAPFVAEGTFVRREVIYHTPTPGLSLRSAELRVGKDCVSTGNSAGLPYNETQKKHEQTTSRTKIVRQRK